MHSRITNRIALVAVIAAFAALPATAGAGVRDGRSPDTKDAAYMAHLDGRSPDTIDAASRAHATPSIVDGRSPDTRDAALAVHTTPATSIVVIDNRGFDWTDAGIGAAGGSALALLLGAGIATYRERRGTFAL
jgi:hypothetical protein